MERGKGGGGGGDDVFVCIGRIWALEILCGVVITMWVCLICIGPVRMALVPRRPFPFNRIFEGRS